MTSAPYCIGGSTLIGEATSYASLTGSIPAGTADGDVLIAVYQHRDNSTLSGVPSGWTQIATATGNATDYNSNVTVDVFWKVWRTGDPTSYTFSCTSSVYREGLLIAAFRGVDVNQPISPSTVTTGNYTGSSASGGTVAIATQNVYPNSLPVVTAGTFWNGNAVSGFTVVDSADRENLWTGSAQANANTSAPASVSLGSPGGVVMFSLAPVGSVVTGGGGGGSGSGLGNMLGGFFVGDTMLGGDPGSGGSGSGGTGMGNMLGGFTPGVTMLGGDPGSGSGTGGGGGGSTANTWQLVAVVATGTTVTGDLTRITQFIQAQPSHGKTTVKGSMSLVPEQLNAQPVNGRTSVRGGLFSPVALNGQGITDHTNVTAALTQSILRGQVSDHTSVSASLTYVVETLRPQTARGSTVPHGLLGLEMTDFAGSMSLATTVTGNAIKPFLVHVDQISCGTSVTGTLDRHILRGTIQGSTRVTAESNLKGHFFGSIHGKTAVSNLFSLLVQLSGTSVGRTTATGRMHSYPTDFHDITIHTGTTIAATINIGHQLAGTSRGKTATTGQITGQWTMFAAAIGRTVVKGNITFPRWFSNGETITGSTTVTADAFKSTLHGGYVHAGTAVTATQSIASRPQGHISAGTKVTVVFNRTYQCSGTIHGTSSAHARMHNYPTDFHDLTIYTGTITTGAINFVEVVKPGSASPITGKTKVVAQLAIKLKLLANTIKAATKVKVYLRYGTGADIVLRTRTSGSLGVFFGINSWKGQAIHGKTIVTAQPPENRFKGLAAGKTTVGAHVTIGWGVAGYAAMYTALHTHYAGRNAHDGAVGFVDLTTLPAGDMGIPDEISGSTVPTADITVERHRVMTVFGNAGVAVERELVAHGTVTAGSGTRFVGEPIDPPMPVAKRITYYV